MPDLGADFTGGFNAGAGMAARKSELAARLAQQQDEQDYRTRSGDLEQQKMDQAQENYDKAAPYRDAQEKYMRAHANAMDANADFTERGKPKAGADNAAQALQDKLAIGLAAPYMKIPNENLDQPALDIKYDALKRSGYNPDKSDYTKKKGFFSRVASAFGWSDASAAPESAPVPAAADPYAGDPPGTMRLKGPGGSISGPMPINPANLAKVDGKNFKRIK